VALNEKEGGGEGRFKRKESARRMQLFAVAALALARIAATLAGPSILPFCIHVSFSFSSFPTSVRCLGNV
jgi:hypothetical protein